MLKVRILGSGSAGNSALVISDNAAVLVDGGLSAKQLTVRLNECGISPADLTVILITHEHGDHCSALPVLLRKNRIPLYSNAHTAHYLRNNLLQDHTNWQTFSNGSDFSIGDLTIRAFTVPHDATDPVGFSIANADGMFGVLTDLGRTTNLVMESLRHVNLLLIEANYDEKMLEEDTKRPWAVKGRIKSSHGHLSNKAAAEIVAQIGIDSLQQVILGHLSRDCNHPELAQRHVYEALQNISRGGITITCAQQAEVGPEFSPLRAMCLRSDEVNPVSQENGDSQNAQD
ncbi:MAG: MBL fold metallo-hydrolase [Chthoniobacterales bacterium]